MDIVGVGVVGTFFTMLVMSAFGMQSQKPPSIQTNPRCPASGQPAHVSLMWNADDHALEIEACDREEFNQSCGQLCLASLSASQGEAQPSNVIG